MSDIYSHQLKNRKKEEAPNTQNNFAQSYFDRSLTIRFLLAFFFTLFLFLFLHFRQTYVQNFELGSTANHYVVAQVDFTFPDEEATIILRQDGASQIRSIYKIEGEEIKNRMIDFQKYFTHDQEKDEKQQGQKGSRVEDILGHESIGDFAAAMTIVTDEFFAARFTDPRTLARIEELNKRERTPAINHYYPFLSPLDGEDAYIPTTFWQRITESLEKQGIIPSFTQLLLGYFQNKRWHFVVDPESEYTIRRLVQESIAPRYTNVKSGQRIIDKDERVTSRHLSMLHAMKKAIDEERNLWDPLTIAGSLAMALLLTIVGSCYLRENHREIFSSNQKLALLISITLLTLLFAKILELFLMQNVGHLMEFARFPLVLPFAAILFASLMNGRIAAFATIFLAIILMVGLEVEPISFMILNITTAFVALLYAKTIRRRKEVFVICCKIWLAALFVILAINLYDYSTLSLSFVSDLLSTFIFVGLTAILVVGLLPIFESLFQILTDITLMEYMDPNNELLRRLSIEAPGTYQHSIVVGNLAEAAAMAIGGNGLFCRVAALYHDIGKLASPQYFTENQLGGIDMHQLLTPLESSQVIIAHVSEGVVLARKYNLPEKFIDIIKEHHGTTLVYYFYHREKEIGQKQGRFVSYSDFRYSGPKPRTRESTIIMIADTLEAASRSLDAFHHESVSELVETLVARKMEDRQFDHSVLTFEELGIVKRVLINTLLAVSHPRVKYPPHHPGEEG